MSTSGTIVVIFWRSFHLGIHNWEFLQWVSFLNLLHNNIAYVDSISNLIFPYRLCTHIFDQIDIWMRLIVKHFDLSHESGVLYSTLTLHFLDWIHVKWHLLYRWGVGILKYLFALGRKWCFWRRHSWCGQTLLGLVRWRKKLFLREALIEFSIWFIIGIVIITLIEIFWIQQPP